MFAAARSGQTLAERSGGFPTVEKKPFLENNKSCIFSPIKYEDVTLASDNLGDEHSQPFLPEVLLHLHPLQAGERVFHISCSKVLKQTVLESQQGGGGEGQRQGGGEVRRTVSWGAGDGVQPKGYRTF